MKTLTVQSKSTNPQQWFTLARSEPLLLVMESGEEFVLTRADNFEAEVEALRNSETFQQFLDERSKMTKKRPITEPFECENSLQTEQILFKGSKGGSKSHLRPRVNHRSNRIKCVG